MTLRLDHLETKHYGIYELEGGCVFQGISSRIEPHIGHSFARHFALVSLGYRSMSIKFEYIDAVYDRFIYSFLVPSHRMTEVDSLCYESYYEVSLPIWEDSTWLATRKKGYSLEDNAGKMKQLPVKGWRGFWETCIEGKVHGEFPKMNALDSLFATQFQSRHRERAVSFRVVAVPRRLRAAAKQGNKVLNH